MTVEPSEIPSAIIALSGYLAERGVTRLELETPAGSREFKAREVNLPAELSAAIARGAATLHAPQIDLVVRFQGATVSWDCKNTADALAIARLFAPC